MLENRPLRAALPAAGEDFPPIGTTRTMICLRDVVRQLAQVEVDVPIEGQNGAGKELVAPMLDCWSKRRRRDFIAIDGAALPDHLADEALFGGRLLQGRIGDADHRTLFPDEIDSMSSALPGKLLRVIEARDTERSRSRTAFFVRPCLPKGPAPSIAGPSVALGQVTAARRR